MKTGIIILNYNDYETTIEMINQIKDYKCLDYILIVDNLSTDKSYKVLKKLERDTIKVIQTKENKGYAYGNNFGIKYLVDNYKVDFIIISNPDIILTEKDIKKLQEDLKDNKTIDLIAPNIKELGNIKRGWRLPSFKDDLLLNLNYFHKVAEKKLLYPEYNYKEKLTKVDAVSGCFFMIRKTSFEKIGFFDENTFLYYEENIIGKKLKDNNMNTYVDNEVFITHNLSVSVDKSINSIRKYKILKDSQKYYEKNYNNLNIFGMILLRTTYYISLFISYIIYFIQSLWR